MSSRVGSGHKYCIVDKIGQGGTSEIFLVRHNVLGGLRVAKKIHKNQKNEILYEREKRGLVKVNVKGVPRLFDVEEDKKHWYLIEEYIEGITFSEYLKAESDDIWSAVKIVLKVCDILLGLAHDFNDRIVHGDIKPENIIVGKKDIYLIDFGNSVIGEFENNFDTDNGNGMFLMGTRAYIAPEQKENGVVDQCIDVYGIGVLLQKIYQKYGKNQEVRGKELLRVVDGCLEKNHEHRISNIAELRSYLEGFLSGKNKVTKVKKYYVFGNRRYCGATHFAIGMTRYLTKNNLSPLYINKNTLNSMVSTLYSLNYGEFREGVIHYGGCRMTQDQGDFFQECQFKDEILIYDMGVFDKERLPDDGQIIFVIADMKVYNNILCDDESIREKGIMCVGNLSDNKGMRKTERLLGVKMEKMPYFENPFLLNPESFEFYSKICGTKSDRRLIVNNVKRMKFGGI